MNIRRNFTILIFSILAAGVIFFGIYSIKVHNINKKYYQKYNNSSQVSLRKFPYPYKAALTICSDIDNTKTLEEFLEISNFINTKDKTSMGEGVGLEIGNSFFFYEPPNYAITYFSEEPDVTRTIKSFIKAGRIDFMHSYGKKYDFTRGDAVLALSELKKNDLNIDVWVDHSKSIDNLGDDVTFGQGDHPDSAAYHADLTLDYGIKFAWLGKVTMIAGQSVPIHFKNFIKIYDSDHPVNSAINIGKEFAKHFLSISGSKKYAMHTENDLVRIAELDDGQKIYEFIRFDNYWEGVGTGANSKRLAYVISDKTLNRLKEVRGYMIVYTHLGNNSDCSQYICKETRNALRNLADEFKKGNIYITTTSKLLNYHVNHKYLDWSYEKKNISISIIDVKDPVFGSFIPSVQDLEGITFYVPDDSKPIIYLNDKTIKNIQENPADHTGRLSITITQNPE